MRYKAKDLNSKYVETYEVVKDFHDKMKKCGWGEGCLPSKYTEELCRVVFDLGNRMDASHDAIDSSGNKIEIKATIGKSSATTINTVLTFDQLYWLRFDFDDDIVYVKVYKNQEVKNYLVSNNKLTGNRENITLNNIVNGKKDDHTIEFI